MRFFNLCPFQQKIKTSGFSLEIPSLENIPQFLENGAEVDQNHDARLEMKWGYIAAQELESERLKSFALSI